MLDVCVPNGSKVTTYAVPIMFKTNASSLVDSQIKILRYIKTSFIGIPLNYHN